MRSNLEDALLIYRQELEGLQLLIAPAILLGPILMIVAASNLTVALATLPFFVLLYGACYAASVRAAGMVLNSREPAPGAVYRGVLAKSIDVAQAAAPVALLVGGVAAVALVASDLGYAPLAPAFAALGILAGLLWAGRHAIDLPLILIYGLDSRDALHASNALARGDGLRALPLVIATSAPLLIAMLAAWGVGVWLTPIVGAGLVAIALAVWLPFAALTLALHTSRLVDAVDAAA